MARLVEVLVWWVLLFGVWVLTLSTLPLSELVVGASCALVCAAAATGCRWAMRARWRMHPPAVRWLPVVATAAVTDACRVLVLPLCGAVGPGRRSGAGTTEEVALDTGPDHAQADTHRALATIAVAATAGSVVVEDRSQEGTLVVHSLADGKPDARAVVRR